MLSFLALIHSITFLVTHILRKLESYDLRAAHTICKDTHPKFFAVARFRTYFKYKLMLW